MIEWAGHTAREGEERVGAEGFGGENSWKV